MRNSSILFLLFNIAAFFFPSCKKFVEIPPPKNELTGESVFNNDLSANSAMVGIYSNMMRKDFGFFNIGITLFSGLSSDEFINQLPNSYQGEFFTNALLPTNDAINALWAEGYKTIYAVNTILEESTVRTIIPRLKTAGAQGIVEYPLNKIIM